MSIESNAITGFLYGSALSALAFLASGGGHGIYAPIALSSAPAGLFGVLAGLSGAPILWLIVGAALKGLGHSSRGRWVAFGVLAHYGSAALLLTREPYSDWNPLLQYNGILMGAIFTLWAIVYVAGQAVVWHALFKGNG